VLQINQPGAPLGRWVWGHLAGLFLIKVEISNVQGLDLSGIATSLPMLRCLQLVDVDLAADGPEPEAEPEPEPETKTKSESESESHSSGRGDGDEGPAVGRVPAARPPCALEALRGMQLITLNIASIYGSGALSALDVEAIASLNTTLTCLGLMSTTITDAGLLVLAKSGMLLESLSLDCCRLVTAAGIAHLADMPLVELYLTGTTVRREDCPPSLKDSVRIC
jgi:hypothetical protein